MDRQGIAALALAAISIHGCQSKGWQPGPAHGERIADQARKLNELQAIGSHNSYKMAIPAAELALIASTSEGMAFSLDYGHAPLAEQLDLGMRQLELDVFHDPEGGLYAEPLLAKVTATGVNASLYDASQMREPGFKVMHIQDIDQRSNCPTLKGCLRELLSWSNANPQHAPILILINAKDEHIPVPSSKTPIPFDEAAFESLDLEINEVIPREKLMTPDDVRGDQKTLRDAVLEKGWPTLEESRGKIFFAIDEQPRKIELYTRGRTSLEGLVAFVNSHDEMAPYAAYFTMNDPITQIDAIQRRVSMGFLVRTRADADTIEARANDTRRYEAALASGAQYISTDYYYSRTELSEYLVRLPGGKPIRCNPVFVSNGSCAE